jgi:hypothetical protein
MLVPRRLLANIYLLELVYIILTQIYLFDSIVNQFLQRKNIFRLIKLYLLEIKYILVYQKKSLIKKF